MAKGNERGPRGPRKRAKGFAFTSGEPINDVPLGIAYPGRVAADVPVLILRRDPGGEPHKPVIERLDQALELNARTIQVYVEGARHEALTPEIGANLDRMAELNDGTYVDAVACMTNYRSTDFHRAAIAETVQSAVRAGQSIRALNYAFTVRETLLKTRDDAELLFKEEARFAHDNVGKGQMPSVAALVRTFIPTQLKNRSDRSISKIKKDLAKREALLESSPVSYGDLIAIAYHAVLTPMCIYPDRVFFDDLFDLAVFAGREALGFREMMDESQLATYRTMLCGGEDLHPVVDARPARALVAAIVRKYWQVAPGLVHHYPVTNA